MPDALKKTSSTLKRQFTTTMLIVLLIILVCSGAIQYTYLSQKIESDVAVEALKVSESIKQGMNETQMATKAIELQLDLKLKLVAERIDDRLGDKPLEEITNEELLALQDEFDIAGITLLTEQGDQGVMGVKSTTPTDIGFSFKHYLGEESPVYQTIHALYYEEELPDFFGAYKEKNTMILPIAPSGSNTDKPTFFKYGYYKPEGKDYIINPYIEANEVYNFTQEVGPDMWIKTVLNSNKSVLELAVLTPQVYADPSLLEIEISDWKKVNYGTFESETEKDVATLVNLVKTPKQVSYKEELGGNTYYKVFIPTSDGKAIYIGLDYDHLSQPLKNMATLLIIFSLISLVALFILSTRFFGRIYKDIQVIITQIKTLESGDFSTTSTIKGKGELADLSNSTNRMTSTLNKVLKNTTKEANKVQNLSLELKTAADESVEKAYALSVDLTSRAREDNYEIIDFLDALEEKIDSLTNKEELEDIKSRIQAVREISNNNTSSTTDMTITLSDLFKSLQAQSVELSNISKTLFENMYKFKL
ncbi:methyl-accepting chemotaxis protein [Bacillus timonensis]|uniref:Methyl-accepting chemotaxis protein n=1 Tax=Bacillus timonensis TaxID=1033734 RepID=A0A4S3PNB1_9BACI|nr:methyl-accepting chemotaxis protein [Bacillus timonensis]THE10616.1 methyl-accepting chemotaxis protein [Bacillus timonensis]